MIQISRFFAYSVEAKNGFFPPTTSGVGIINCDRALFGSIVVNTTQHVEQFNSRVDRALAPLVVIPTYQAGRVSPPVLSSSLRDRSWLINNIDTVLEVPPSQR